MGGVGCGVCVSASSAQPHLQPFQLLLEVVLIHKLDFAELLLIFQVLLPHQLYLPKDLSRPVAGSPSGWSGDGEWWGCHTEIMGWQARGSYSNSKKRAQNYFGKDLIFCFKSIRIVPVGKAEFKRPTLVMICFSLFFYFNIELSTFLC